MMVQTDQDGQVWSLASKGLQQCWGWTGPKKLHYNLREGFFEEVWLYRNICTIIKDEKNFLLQAGRSKKRKKKLGSCRKKPYTN